MVRKGLGFRGAGQLSGINMDNTHNRAEMGIPGEQQKDITADKKKASTKAPPVLCLVTLCLLRGLRATDRDAPGGVGSGGGRDPCRRRRRRGRRRGRGGNGCRRGGWGTGRPTCGTPRRGGTRTWRPRDRTLRRRGGRGTLPRGRLGPRDLRRGR